MIDELMRAYTGTGGMMYQGMPDISTAEYAEYQLDYDPRTYTFTTNAYPVEDIRQGWWELFTSDDTDGQEPEPDPEPCTETELTDFLGI